MTVVPPPVTDNCEDEIHATLDALSSLAKFAPCTFTKVTETAFHYGCWIRVSMSRPWRAVVHALLARRSVGTNVTRGIDQFCCQHPTTARPTALRTLVSARNRKHTLSHIAAARVLANAGQLRQESVYNGPNSGMWFHQSARQVPRISKQATCITVGSCVARNLASKYLLTSNSEVWRTLVCWFLKRASAIASACLERRYAVFASLSKVSTPAQPTRARQTSLALTKDARTAGIAADGCSALILMGFWLLGQTDRRNKALCYVIAEGIAIMPALRNFALNLVDHLLKTREGSSIIVWPAALTPSRVRTAQVDKRAI